MTAEVRLLGAAVWTVRDGLITRAFFYTDREDAFNQRGLEPGRSGAAPLAVSIPFGAWEAPERRCSLWRQRYCSRYRRTPPSGRRRASSRAAVRRTSRSTPTATRSRSGLPEQSGSPVRTSFRVAGGQFEPPQTLDACGAMLPRVDVDAQGNFTALWVGCDGTVQAATGTAPSGFGPATTIAPPGNDARAYPVLDVAPSGAAVAAWQVAGRAEGAIRASGWQLGPVRNHLAGSADGVEPMGGGPGGHRLERRGRCPPAPVAPRSKPAAKRPRLGAQLQDRPSRRRACRRRLRRAADDR